MALTPRQLRAKLIENGATVAKIARTLKPAVSRQRVSEILNGVQEAPPFRIRKAIAAAAGVTYKKAFG